MLIVLCDLNCTSFIQQLTPRHPQINEGAEYKGKFRSLATDGGGASDDSKTKLLGEICTFVDMVPPFRDLATKSMGNMIELQKGQLYELGEFVFHEIHMLHLPRQQRLTITAIFLCCLLFLYSDPTPIQLPECPRLQRICNGMG